MSAAAGANGTSSKKGSLADAPDLLPGDDPTTVIGDGPVVLIGHSLGGHQAFRIAAAEPPLVSRLVVIEASPEPNTRAPDDVRAFFTAHPAPYGTAVDPDAAAAAVADLTRDWWGTWASITCPTLVVRAEHGHVPRPITVRMAETLGARSVEIAGAGHDVHLDQPVAVAVAIASFLNSPRDAATQAVG